MLNLLAQIMCASILHVFATCRNRTLFGKIYLRPEACAQPLKAGTAVPTAVPMAVPMAVGPAVGAAVGTAVGTACSDVCFIFSTLALDRRNKRHMLYVVLFNVYNVLIFVAVRGDRLFLNVVAVTLIVSWMHL